MKITKRQLTRIIKEELGRQVLQESIEEKTKISNEIVASEDLEVINSLLDRAAASGWIQKLAYKNSGDDLIRDATYPKIRHTWEFYSEPEFAEALEGTYEQLLPKWLQVSKFNPNWDKPRSTWQPYPVTIWLVESIGGNQ